LIDRLIVVESEQNFSYIHGENKLINYTSRWHWNGSSIGRI